MMALRHTHTHTHLRGQTYPLFLVIHLRPALLQARIMHSNASNSEVRYMTALAGLTRTAIVPCSIFGLALVGAEQTDSRGFCGI